MLRIDVVHCSIFTNTQKLTMLTARWQKNAENATRRTTTWKIRDFTAGAATKGLLWSWL